MAFADGLWVMFDYNRGYAPDSESSNSDLNVRVFSNCDEVELHLEGELMERHRPDVDRIATHLA
jgi:beta-galactosidase